MKKSKKIISLLLSILMIITSIPLMAVNSFAAEIFTSGDYQYTVLDDGTAEITKYTGSAAELAIPSEIDGYSVTSIGYRAFFGFYGSSLTSITIPDSVTSIGEDAFSWSALTSITIPDNVTSIGASAFSACTSLASVTIGNGVTSISHNAFGSCTSLTSITIPDSVTSIGYYAFYGCTSLASVTIGNGVTSIAGSAFNGCTSLTEISVNSENANYSSENGVLFNKDKTEIVRYPQGKKDSSYPIPDSVTSIGNDAFYGCTSLSSITIPDSITSIGNSAFNGCTSLASVTIGNGVTSIGNDAFYGCTSLASITIPDSVTSIGNYAFYYCTSLASIIIPNSVTSIGYSAFIGCNSLTEINVSSENANYSSENGVLFNKDKTEIVRYPSGKTATCYSIPDGVTSIGDNAFYGCTSLSSITIPDSVTNIGDHAFYNTAYYNDKSNWDNGTLYIGNHLIKAKSDITESIEIKQGTKTIADSAFSGCTSLTSITIPDSVTSIGDHAFRNNKFLENVIIGNNVTNIGDEAFSYCPVLTSVIIPDSVTSIGNYAFSGIDELVITGSIAGFEYNATAGVKNLILEKDVIDTGINFHNLSGTIENITVSEENAVYSSIYGVLFNKDKTELIRYPKGKKETAYKIPDGVTSIGDYAFKNNKFLENVIIGNNVTNIGDEAFSYCPVLTSVIIPDSVTSIGNYAFRGCTSLTSITIPNSVTSISHNAFGSCTSLTSITIPDSVTSIGSWAFSGCTSLTSITIPDSVTSIGFRAFLFTSLTSITIPQSVTYISEEALGYYYDNVKIDGFTIYGFGGTKAEKYAKDNSFKFVDLRESESLTVSKAPTKTTYFVDDTLDITGLELTLTYNNGDTETVTSGFTVSGFDSSTAGTKVVTVEYKGKTATFTVEVVEPTVSFPDVSATEWYSNAIAFNVTKGYFHGYANGYFGPADNIQRQDFVVVLAKIANADLSAYAGQNGDFDDVPTNDYYSAAVAWAKANHILSGYANGKFGVGDPITREQACLIFYNYCNGSVSGNVNTVLAGYPDGGNVSDWARTAVAWAAQNNVVGGNGKLNPAGNANRAEMAQIIMNMSNNDIL